MFLLSCIITNIFWFGCLS